ncbi:cytochrome oxidase assembly protein 1 [Diplodia intermedia]|uniref:Cytochrome oxidase assembly protein 1 n=1 Tax=Diplodia intermedia TaxID=856260 RepID=A0ABR3T2C0_9PEZI
MRRADRALPSVRNPSALRWAVSLPLFGAIIAGATAAIFNYQKQSSSVVEATLYALRTHPEAREYLGGEIQFASSVPWISGTIDQLHGRIDFETLEWSLTTQDGKTIQLLDVNGPDPFRRTAEDDED